MKYKTNWLGGILAPMLIMAPAYALQTNIAASGAHTVFIDNGVVFAMGSNTYGEINPGGAQQYATPFLMGITNAKTVAATQWRVAVLKTDGTAVLRGLNYSTFNQGVYNFPASGITDIALSLSVVYFLKDGQVYSWSGDPSAAPVAVPGASSVNAIAAGYNHLVVLFSTNTVGTYGANGNGQLGDGTATAATSVVRPTVADSILEIAAGANTTFVRTVSGVYGFGENGSYQLGLADGMDRKVPTLVPNLTGVTKMMPGSIFTAMKLSDGTVSATGWHDYIMGGLYNTNKSFVQMPIGTVNDGAAGSDHMIVRPSAATNYLAGWGGNVYGKLGTGDNTELHVLTNAYYTPPAPPVVVVPPPPAPVVPPVVETGSAISNPLQPVPPAVTMPSTPPATTTIGGAIIDTVVDGINTGVKVVKDAIKKVKEYFDDDKKDDKKDDDKKEEKKDDKKDGDKKDDKKDDGKKK